LWAIGGRIWALGFSLGFFFQIIILGREVGLKKELGFVFSCGATFVFLGLFCLLLRFNVLSLLGYIPPLRVRYLVVFPLALRVWAGAQRKKFRSLIFLLSHFCPQGAPRLIIFFLFCIEGVSWGIQPITLSVRLLANILTGHILLSLILESVFFSFFGGLTGLIFLELGVAGIQRFVFLLLCLFYRKLG